MNNKYFDRKVIWITSSSSGIAWSSATSLAPLAKRLIISLRKKDKLEGLSMQLSSKVELKILAFDMQNESEIADVLREYET